MYLIGMVTLMGMMMMTWRRTVVVAVGVVVGVMRMMISTSSTTVRWMHPNDSTWTVMMTVMSTAERWRCRTAAVVLTTVVVVHRWSHSARRMMIPQPHGSSIPVLRRVIIWSCSEVPSTTTAMTIATVSMMVWAVFS